MDSMRFFLKAREIPPGRCMIRHDRRRSPFSFDSSIFNPTRAMSLCRAERISG